MLKVKIRFWISFLLIAFVFSWQLIEQRRQEIRYFDNKGEEKVLVVPARDRKRLYLLMERLFADDSFAYTVLGTKPISWATYRTIRPITDAETFLDSLRKYHRTFRQGWKTWEKYHHHFPNSNLWAEKSERHPGSVSILIANRDHFNTVMRQNKTHFETALNRPITAGDQLLQETRTHSLMDGVLKGHQALLGIVLGYGTENSWKFHESCITRRFLGCVWGEPYPEANLEIDPDTTYTELLMTLYSCPSFTGDPDSEESKALKKSYLKTKQDVLEYYKGKDFLEATLSLLAGYRPQRNTSSH